MTGSDARRYSSIIIFDGPNRHVNVDEAALAPNSFHVGVVRRTADRAPRRP
jgi:hypothetical protein